MLPHERHVAVQVRDRADVTLLAESDAAGVAADVDGLRQLARLQVEDLHQARARNPHVRLHVVRSDPDTERPTRELDVGRDLPAREVDLVEEAIFVAHIEGPAGLGHREVLRRAADIERPQYLPGEHVELGHRAALRGARVHDPTVRVDREAVGHEPRLHATDDLPRLRVYDVHRGASRPDEKPAAVGRDAHDGRVAGRRENRGDLLRTSDIDHADILAVLVRDVGGEAVGREREARGNVTRGNEPINGARLRAGDPHATVVELGEVRQAVVAYRDAECGRRDDGVDDERA